MNLASSFAWAISTSRCQAPSIDFQLISFWLVYSVHGWPEVSVRSALIICDCPGRSHASFCSLRLDKYSLASESQSPECLNKTAVSHVGSHIIQERCMKPWVPPHSMAPDTTTPCPALCQSYAGWERTIPGFPRSNLAKKSNKPQRLAGQAPSVAPHSSGSHRLHSSPPRAAANALHPALAEEEACAAVPALPNRIVNCFTAACES